MDTKQLRQKILDLAIHGKLVPQDPNDEPASVLLERIRSEKEQLWKDGKIKGSEKIAKSLDKVPFEVPEGWVWCRLGDVCEIARGGSPRPIKEYLTDSDDGVNWIKIGDTSPSDKYIRTVKEKIKPEGVKRSRYVHKGDFLLTNSMSFGHPYILDVDGCIHDGWLVISPYNGVYDTDFLYYLLSSSFAYEQFSQEASGGVVSNLNSDKVAATKFPILSLAEQQRIVAEIKRWFTLVDQLEQSQSDLQTAIKQTKSKILDLAIHGKLVPQDPADEPAINLLRRINPKFTPCFDNAKYGKMPSRWALCHMNDIADSLLGKTLDRSRNTGTPKKYLCALNVKWNNFDFSSLKEFLLEDNELERYSVRKGDLMVCEGGDVGRAAIWEEEDEMYYQNALHRIRVRDGISNKFLLYQLMLLKTCGIIDDTCKGVTIKHFTQTVMNSLDLLLPPLAEQHRIVSRIEELFAKLDAIQASLS